MLDTIIINSSYIAISVFFIKYFIYLHIDTSLDSINVRLSLSLTKESIAI